MCLVAWEPTSGGCHSSGKEGDGPSPSARMPLHLSEGNNAGLDDLSSPLPMGLLQRSQSFWECLGGVRGSEGRALSQTLSPWLNFLDLSSYLRNQAFQGPGPLTLPPNHPAPVECSPLTFSHPTPLPNTDTPVFLHRSDWRCRKPSPWVLGGWGVQGEKFSDPNPHSPFNKIVSQILFWDSFPSKHKVGEKSLWFLRGRLS